MTAYFLTQAIAKIFIFYIELDLAWDDIAKNNFDFVRYYGEQCYQKIMRLFHNLLHNSWLFTSWHVIFNKNNPKCYIACYNNAHFNLELDLAWDDIAKKYTDLISYFHEQ